MALGKDIKKIINSNVEVTKGYHQGNVVWSSLQTWEKYDTKPVMYASRGAFISSNDSYLLKNANQYREVIDNETGRLGEPITPSQIKRYMNVIRMDEYYPRWFYIKSNGTYYNGGGSNVGYLFSEDMYASTITTREEKNNLIETVEAEEGTYPNNGRHTDGFWYVKI